MVHDYLGLDKQPKTKKLTRNDDGFLNTSSDYLGLGSFAAQNARDVGHARKYVKGQIREYRNAYSEIKKEAHEFKQDLGRGGWIGDYIRRKTSHPKPKKFSHTF